MLDFALERYPIEICLPSGLEVQIRPLDKYDEDIFQRFMLAVPEVERSFIKERLTDPSIFHRWCSEIDYESNLPLLAFKADKLVAVGTLHQRQGGWRRHIGVVSVLTHPKYRGRGLVYVLIEELIYLSRHGALTKLEAEFNGEREDGMRVFLKAGFNQLVRLPAYVQDRQSGLHDYVLMGMDLVPPEEYLAAAD